MVFLVLVADQLVKLRLQGQQDWFEAGQVAHDCNCLVLLHLAAADGDKTTLSLVVTDAGKDGQEGPL